MLFIIEFQVQIVAQKIGSVSETYVIADSKRYCTKVIRNMRHSQGYLTSRISEKSILKQKSRLLTFFYSAYTHGLRNEKLI